jgi:hypothetical protein
MKIAERLLNIQLDKMYQVMVSIIPEGNCERTGLKWEEAQE